MSFYQFESIDLWCIKLICSKKKNDFSLFLGINSKMLVNYDADKWVLQLALMFVETIFKLLSVIEFCQA